MRCTWPPEGMFCRGSGGPPPEFDLNFEAKPLLLGTFHSVPSSAAKFPSRLTNHLNTDNQIIKIYSRFFQGV